MSLQCPFCASEIDTPDCEKTVVCGECRAEWKWADGMQSLESVDPNDPIYWDR